MKLEIKGSNFGAANKFQKIKYTHKQSSKHSNIHSSNKVQAMEFKGEAIF
jgi:hypothetical protein